MKIVYIKIILYNLCCLFFPKNKGTIKPVAGWCNNSNKDLNNIVYRNNYFFFQCEIKKIFYLCISCVFFSTRKIRKIVAITEISQKYPNKPIIFFSIFFSKHYS